MLDPRTNLTLLRAWDCCVAQLKLPNDQLISELRERVAQRETAELEEMAANKLPRFIWRLAAQELEKRSPWNYEI
jgi:hypothetical protein